MSTLQRSSTNTVVTFRGRNFKDQLAKEQSRAQALSIYLLKYCSWLHDSNKPHQAYNGLAHLRKLMSRASHNNRSIHSLQTAKACTLLSDAHRGISTYGRFGA